MAKILLVLPVYNEEDVLEKSVSRLVAYMNREVGQGWRILIADNASTDGTSRIATNLSKRYKAVAHLRLDKKGRGRALKLAWTTNKADIYAYCDIDLATELKYLKEMFDAIGHGADIAIGNRYLPGSDSRRSVSRFLLSKVYIILVKMFFRTKITDFQCGFKAVNSRIVKQVIPKVENNNWFFDTELLIIAEQARKYKIMQIPVKWKEGETTKVNIGKTVKEYVNNLIDLKRRLSGQ